MVEQSSRNLSYRLENPATGDVIERFETTSDAEVQAALRATDGAFRDWCQKPIEERAAVAKRVAELFAERKQALAEIIAREVGKPVWEGIEEVDFCTEIFDYFADKGPTLAADQPIETFAGGQAFIERRAIGVLLGIMPWNFPYYQVARFVAPNLVLGNTIILKHAEICPRSSAAIEQIMTDAGLPAGAYVNLFATHQQIADIIADDRVQGVSLTGSERAGSAIGALAGQHLKKAVLELGGCDPYIVLDTDDVKQSAHLAWQTRLYNAGQACNANKRLIVMDDIYDDFVAELTQLAAGMKPGKPEDDREDTYAPLSSRAAAETLDTQVRQAVAQGATLHAGGELQDDRTAYYSPAVLTGVTSDMAAYREELFGPVAVVYKARDDDEALALANDSQYGLGGAVFSTNAERAAAVARQLDVGMANVNTPAGMGAELPFGGVKRSGFGRELGPLGMEEFVNKRLYFVAD